MTNLYRALIESAPVKTRLQFGHNENVILEKAELNTVRKNKGMPINANTFLTLTQIDPETRKPKASFEGSFWNIDPTSEYAEGNFIDQLNTLASLVDAIGGDSVEYVNAVVEASGAGDDEDALIAMATDKVGSVTLMKAMQDALEVQIKDKTGKQSPIMQCKIVTNKKGYLEIPNELGWILPMDSEEALPPVSDAEQARYNKSLESTTPKTAAPDTPGEAPSGEADVAEGGGDFIGL